MIAVITHYNPTDDMPNIIHYATTWELWNTTDTSNTDNRLATVESSTTYLEIWYTDVNIPPGEKYYVRVKRVFKNTDSNILTDGNWSDMYARYGDTIGDIYISTQDTYIEEPIIEINKTELLNSLATTVTISTGSFYGVNVGHKATSWFILGDDNDVIYSSINDEVNLTSIVVDKADLSLTNNFNITVLALHEGTEQIVSPVGKLNIKTTSLNYIVSNKLTNLTPYQAANIKLTRISTDIPYSIASITIVDESSGDTLYSNNAITIINDTISLPSGIMTPNLKCILKIYDNNGTVSNIKLSTTALHVFNNYDLTYNYNNTLTLINNSDAITLLSTKKVSAFKMYDGSIPLPNSANTALIIGNDIDGTITLTSNVISGTESAYGTEVAIIPTGTNTVIVSKLVTGHYVLYGYLINTATNAWSVIWSTVTNDTHGLSVLNRHTIVNDTYLYYVPYGSRMLKRVNIVTGAISDIGNVPNVDFDTYGGTLSNIGNNRILIVGGSDEYCYTYDIATGEFESVNTTPIQLRNRNIRSTELINNNILLYGVSYKEGDDNNYIYVYDTYHNMFMGVTGDYDSNYFTSDIMLNNSVALFSNTTSMLYT